MIGQVETWNRLLKMVSEGRIPHAMMLCGPRGCGKLSMAMRFARYLLCPNRTDSEPCGECPQCQMMSNFQHPDLLMSYPVIKPTGSSSDYKPTSDDYAREWQELISTGLYFDINQWLQQMKATTQQAIYFVAESDRLLKRLSLKSSQGGYKVSIIWLPERMREDCANKMLKLLEEPPSQTIFIMVCEEPERLLETIRSRVQRIDMPRLSPEEIAQALVQKRGLAPEMAQRLSRLCNGSWLEALQHLTDDNEDKQFLQFFITLMRLAYKRDVKEMGRWADSLATNFGREQQRRFLNYCLRMVRENFVYNFRQPELCYMTLEEEEFAKNFARFINEANIIPISELLQRCHRDIGQNANAKMVFFDLALQMIVLLLKK